MSTSGNFTAPDFPSGTADYKMTGLAVALWFTQADDSHMGDAIGPMTSDGHYSSRFLPQRNALPMRIAAEPDGSLWFAERLGNRIGRIAAAGALTEFDLPAGTEPFAIVIGNDGALWFATNDGPGRTYEYYGASNLCQYPVHQYPMTSFRS